MDSAFFMTVMRSRAGLSSPEKDLEISRLRPPRMELKATRTRESRMMSRVCWFIVSFCQELASVSSSAVTAGSVSVSMASMGGESASSSGWSEVIVLRVMMMAMGLMTARAR